MDAVGLGSRIKELREAADISGEQLAIELGVDGTAVSKIEHGKRSVKASELATIARTLGVSPLAILEPDSLLGRLPVAARSGSDMLDEAVHNRLQALAELHSVLADAGITDPELDRAWPEVDLSRWLASAQELAEWCTQRLAPADTTDRFEALAEAMESKLGIDVLVEPADSDSAMGAAITDPEFPIVFVNSRQIRARAMFTLAHELGHVLSRDGVALRVDRDLAGTDERERFANAFAAELLMPKSVIEEMLRDKGRNAEGLAAIMVRLQVSFETLVYRLHNLRYIDAHGRDQFKSLGFGGLLADLTDDALRGELLKLRTEMDSTRPPQLLLNRLLRGYFEGVVSARPIAGLLNATPEEVIAILKPDQESDSVPDSGRVQVEPLIQFNAPTASSNLAPEELFAGSPV